MAKLGDFFFKGLWWLMLGTAIFWLGSSLVWLLGFNLPAALILAILLGGVGVLFRRKILSLAKPVYDWAMGHKVWLVFFTILYQIALLLSATMMIRSDAAVVFTGATGLLEPHRIASYLTRNPNNLLLFLYERAFYKLFGSQTIWVLQGLNIFYTHLAGWLLYRAARRFFSQKIADRVFVFYLVLIALTPKFMAMYTDIMVLPLLAGQVYLILKLIKNWTEEQLSVWSVLALGALTGLAVHIRPTSAIMLIAFFFVIFLKQKWLKCLTILTLITLSFGSVYLGISSYKQIQKEVKLVKGEGLAKNWLTFINLGLTFSGTDQEDMKAGLAAYLPAEKREIYDNGRFANRYQLAEIKRRISEYTPWTFLLHTLYKQYLTTGQGNLNWIYKKASREKTAYMSPLTEATRGNPVAGFLRSYFIYSDRADFAYYDLCIQIIWIILAFGLLGFFSQKDSDDTRRMLALALFGGLLFLQIFEGGKSRYLIQFMPQILLIAALGLEQWKKGTRATQAHVRQ